MSKDDLHSYDYLIVGGGSAGCVLANRLSASGKFRVCLIEAGPNDGNPFIHMPAGVIPLARGLFANWKFWSEPQTNLKNRKTYQPRGKVIGGSSCINAMVCTRGDRQDYDDWAALGCDGWSYDEVLPYFRKSETYQPQTDADNAQYHGTEGPLQVSERPSTNPLSEAFVAAAIQAGYAPNDDFNGPNQEGVGQYKVFQNKGRRCSNGVAYLTPDVRKRSNLDILTRAQVTRILFAGEQATGIEFNRRGKTQSLLAKREVILSAGAFQSPQLLLLSGIGPKEQLADHGIALKRALPGVGANLQDHLEVIVETKSKSRVAASFHPLALLRNLKALLLFWLKGSGEFTSNAAEAGGFIRSSSAETRPDIQWHFAAIPNVYHGLRLGPLFTRWAYIVFINEMRPRSRGCVTLASADPLVAPKIDPNYLDDPADLDKLVLGTGITRAVLAQSPFAAHRDVELSPGPDIQSDQDLAEWIREHAETVYHPVGSCKMGIDAMAVVDPQLRVHGLKGLRVVDASIMPNLVGSNTNAPTTMIAEKAAEMILAGAR